MNKNKIGILTWHYFNNFGSVLQAFALNRTVEMSVIINYSPYVKKNSVLSRFKGFIKYIISHSIGKNNFRFRYSYDVFRWRYFKLSKPIISGDDLKIKANHYSIIIFGSDQIWAPNVYNPLYFGNFCLNKNTKKVSYAASIGLNDIPVDLQANYANHLSDFSSISVREETGRKLLNEKCFLKNVEVVLDPTLLLDIDSYIRVERKVRIDGKFLFCYFLNANNSYQKSVENYAKKNNLRIVGWSADKNNKSWLEMLDWIGPGEFLWLIHNSSFVATDSYHGSIFSLLYHKKFCVFRRFLDGDPINQNSRIFQLDKLFHISPMIIDSNGVVDDYNFDYQEFEKRLKEKKKESLLFLKKALM